MTEPEVDTTTTTTETVTTPPPADAGKGFPENTPLAEMTVDQQAAYWRDKAQKHERRASAYHTAVGGKTADEVRAELEAAATLRQSQLSDAERQLEEARNAARQEAAAQFGNKLVAAEFKAALAHVDGERRDQIIAGLNLSAYLTDNGDVDTDKVSSYAAAIAPAVKDTGNDRHDFGAGRRGNGSSSTKTGVAAGAALFEARKKPTPTT